MPRRVATLLLVVPLFFNGLRMVCADERGGVDREALVPGAAQAVPECDDEMCSMKKRHAVASEGDEGPPSSGALCLILPTGDGACLGAIVSVPASTPIADDLSAVFAARELVTEAITLYASPSLAEVTLPPEA